MKSLTFLVLFQVIIFANCRRKFRRSGLTRLELSKPIITDINRFIGKTDSKTGEITRHLGESKNPEEYGSYYGGDMLLLSDSANHHRAGVVNAAYRWPSGLIPYEINGNFTTAERDTILAAMQIYRNKTCIRFIPRIRQSDYVSFESQPSGCFSMVGRVGGKQTVNLQNPTCLQKIGIVLHEMMHVVGFNHEHIREDRDTYIVVKWANVFESAKSNFEKSAVGTTNSFNAPYAYDSVMHYSRYAFAIDGSQDTITPLVNNTASARMGQRDGFVQTDIDQINSMYKCF